MKIRILENIHLPAWVWHRPNLIGKDFSDEIGGNMIFLISSNEMHQELEKLNHSVNQNFLSFFFFFSL